MVELREQYLLKSNAELVRIIDLEDYTPEAKMVARNVLEENKVLPSALHKIAMEEWLEYCKHHFRTIVSDTIKLKSEFLNQKDFEILMQEAYEYHKERQELFEIDLTKYWGAAL